MISHWCVNLVPLGGSAVLATAGLALGAASLRAAEPPIRREPAPRAVRAHENPPPRDPGRTLPVVRSANTKPRVGAPPFPVRTPLGEGVAAKYLETAWSKHAEREAVPHGLAVLLAHWALETGRGEYMMNNNFAGLKGTAPGGAAVELWTREVSGGEARMTRERFRSYASPQAGADDYVRLLKERYPKAFRAIHDGNVIAFVAGLKERGYFTDEGPSYERAMRSLWLEYASEGHN